MSERGQVSRGRSRGRPRGRGSRTPRGHHPVTRGRRINDDSNDDVESETNRSQVLQDIVNRIDVSESRQQQLDEEVDISPVDANEMGEEPLLAQMAQNVPPGEPIPIFTIQSWKAPWRRHFFTDWRWAPKNKGDSQVWARCKLGSCGIKQPPHYYSGSASSFTNFEKHLSLRHYEEYQAFENQQKTEKSPAIKNQPGIESFTVRRGTQITKKQQEKLDTDLAFTIAMDNLPLNILRRPRFRKWVHFGMDGYKLPGVDRMRNKILPTIVQNTRVAVSKILKASTSFTIVLDIWSSKTMMGYIGFTCICVDRDFNRYTLFLGVKKMENRHTADNILAEYEQLVNSWEIPRSRIAMVKTDGGSNMVANTFFNNIPGWDEEEDEVTANTPSPLTDENSPDDMVEMEISEEDPLWDLLQEAGLSLHSVTAEEEELEEIESVETSFEQIMPSSSSIITPQEKDGSYLMFSRLRSDCVAHKLQLVVKDGLKHLPVQARTVISHVSKIVNSVRKSVIDTQMIVSSVGFRLPAKNSTRWNSTFYMLATFLKAVDKDPSLLARLNAIRKHSTLTAFELIVVREIVAILKPFENASNDFQADFETIGNVIPAYLGLMNALTLTVKDRNGVDIPNSSSFLVPKVKKCKETIIALRESLKRRFAYVLHDANYVLGTIFDPRFKKSWIRSSGFAEADVLDAVKIEVELRYRSIREANDGRKSFNPDDETSTAEDENLLSESGVTQERTGRPQTARKRRYSQSLYSSVIEMPRPSSVGPAKVLEELEAYLAEPNVPIEVLKNPEDPESELITTKPLEYWKTNSSRFPIVSQIARDSVSVAASSGSIERSFSSASDILSAKRSAMKSDLFCNLMLVKCNSRLTEK